MLKVVYGTFGLTYKMALSTRPEEKLGDDAMWDQAEGALQGALDETGLEWEVSPAFFHIRKERNVYANEASYWDPLYPKAARGSLHI